MDGVFHLYTQTHTSRTLSIQLTIQKLREGLHCVGSFCHLSSGDVCFRLYHYFFLEVSLVFISLN